MKLRAPRIGARSNRMKSTKPNRKLSVQQPEYLLQGWISETWPKAFSHGTQHVQSQPLKTCKTMKL